MGAGNIIENSIKSTTSSIWDRVPKVADQSWLSFDLKDYNKAFVNLSVVFGVIVVAKTALKITCKTIHAASKSNNLPTAEQLHDKYGHHSWAVIGDCRGNEEYAKFLAANGFNLVLIGAELDVQIAKDQSQTVNKDIEIDCVEIDWKNEEENIKFYQDLMERLQNRDVAFLVLPRIWQARELVPTHLEHVQPFAHVFLLVRFFCQKLTNRSYKSGIIFPSCENYDNVSRDNGVSKSMTAGADAFGRIINHQQKQNFEVVVARGSVQNAFRGLGKKNVTH